MADATHAILTASIPTLAVLIGIRVNNSRLGDVNRHIEDTRDLLRAEFFRVEQVLDTRLKHIEEDR
jgi:hypothetical protein